MTSSFTFNVHSETNFSGSGKWGSDQEDPSRPTNLNCTTINSSEITVYLNRDTSEVDYYIIYVQCPTDLSQQYCPSSVTESGFQYIFDGLYPFTNYTFTVTAYRGSTSDSNNVCGESGIHAVNSNDNLRSEPVPLECHTHEYFPTAVQQLASTSVDSTYTTINWEIPAEPNGIIRRYIINVTGEKEKNKVDTNDTRPRHSQDPVNILSNNSNVLLNANSNFQSPNAQYQYNITGLLAGYRYTIQVIPVTIGNGQLGTGINVTTPIKPPVAPILQPEHHILVGSGNFQKSKFTITVYDVFSKFSNSTGTLAVHQIIVSSTQDISPLLNNTELIKNYTKDATTYVAKYCPEFFTSCGQSTRTKRQASTSTDTATDTSTNIEIGSDSSSSCSSVTPCNPTLKSGTTYYVFYRVCNENYQCTSSPALIIETKPDYTLAICLGIILPLIVIIVLIVILIVYFKKRQPPPPEVPGVPVGPQDSEKKIFPQQTSKPVNMVEFGKHVEKMAKDSGLEYTAEYEDLKLVGKDQSCDQADLPCNRAKNRYTNIKPYDVCRVKLLPVEDEEGSDYINASWIPGFNSKREFIAAQGPLPGTKDDFWRMIWEYNCRGIVMLTKCSELGRVKCDHYWPTDMDPVFYGDLQVTILSEQLLTDEVDIREFQIAMGQQVRRLRHFHLKEWPDHGVPDSLMFLKFIRSVRNDLPARGGPIVVHCSAGVGRTGTFIAADTILRQLEQNQPMIDIYGVVYRMRMNRPCMVQTEGQYIGLHNTILYHVNNPRLPDEPETVIEDDEGLYANQDQIQYQSQWKPQMKPVAEVTKNQ